MARSLPLMFRAVAGLMLALASSGCEPELVVGKWACPDPEPVGMDNNAGGDSMGKVVPVPWTTGFETGLASAKDSTFCDYHRVAGFCYADGGGSYSLAGEPVHGGEHAAAYSVASDTGVSQARCFVEGTLPDDAKYGAWFYLPALAQNNGNWNLIHFQGGDPPPSRLPNLWDVSLRNDANGDLFLYVYDSVKRIAYEPDTPTIVPIGKWFHVEFRLRRASDATGLVALYLNGALEREVSGIVTDATVFGQYYVGNWADGLVPPDSTIYVDDVTIR